MLDGDQWTVNLDKVIDMVINDDDKIQPLKQLQQFFNKHLTNSFIPFNDEKEYESQAKSHVSQWLTYRYSRLLNYFEENPIQNDIKQVFEILSDFFIKDSEKLPAGALAFLYYQLRGNIENTEVLSSEIVQNKIYSQALSLIEKDKTWCMQVLTKKLPGPHPDHVFTDLFFAVIKTNLNQEETQNILRHFSSTLSRILEK